MVSMIKSKKSMPLRKRKDSGVSEILGDMMILGITVTLFSTIFLYVNAFPTPNAQTFANFSASLTDNNTQLVITHEGGQPLSSSLTSVVVQINQSTSVYTLNDGLYLTGLNTTTTWKLPRWSTDQTWAINLTGISASSVVGVSIIDKANNFLVWSTVLNGRSVNLKPLIQYAYVSPNPISPGNSIIVYAELYSMPKNPSSINLTANFSLVSSAKNSSVKMTYNSTSGAFSSPLITTSKKNLSIGFSYPITLTLTGPGKYSTNYSLMLDVEQTGPTIVTASINPNPSSPGQPFNITAYVVDSNASAFNPATHKGSITVSPQGPDYITNITKTTEMNSSQYQGIFLLSGKVNGSANFTSFETFKITATDANGNSAFYIVELFLNYFLNPNQYYPSKYLGPTSMSFSDFSWNVSNEPNSYSHGYNISASDVSSPGIYFHVTLENHNASDIIYIDDLSNLYFLFNDIAQNLKEYSAMSFIENNTTYSTLSTSSAIPLYANQSKNVTFGIASATAPPSGHGPFQGIGNGQKYVPTSQSISFDFILLFGWIYNINTHTTTPYAQTLPFDAIYWY
ncbi:MAG: type IV pilin [Thermoplasmata archaeon]|uniref:Type IV pilin n=1 Tax=Candidatus Sysuiplasma superficiale TaxID=2823368 RepID=A0A8J7YRI5_9ARCH|nr:type IV pilin [Candidatus Sysuiplasma superficiale]